MVRGEVQKECSALKDLLSRATGTRFDSNGGSEMHFLQQFGVKLGIL